MDHGLIRLNLSLIEKIISLPQLKLVYGLSYNIFYDAFKKGQMAAATTARDSPRNILWAKSRWVWHILLAAFLEDTEMAVTCELEEYWSNVVL